MLYALNTVRDSEWEEHEALADSPTISANTLPFVVRVVRTEAHLQEVCDLRALAYGKRMPEFGRALSVPEPSDKARGTTILMAQDKGTGEVVGTLRIHSNIQEPLPIQGVVDIPKRLQENLLVELCRFSIKPGYNKTTVRLGLFKAMYLYCYAHQVQYIWVAARKPLNEIYKSLGFHAPDGGEEQWVPLSYADNIPHSILMFDVLAAERTWFDMRHPLYEFMGRTYHPDIQVFRT
jgi:hypothetical protein